MSHVKLWDQLFYQPQRYLPTKTLIMDSSPNDPFPAHTTIENKLTIFVFTPMWKDIRPSFCVKYATNGFRIGSFKFVNQRLRVGRFENFRTDLFVSNQCEQLRHESKAAPSAKWNIFIHLQNRAYVLYKTIKSSNIS